MLYADDGLTCVSFSLVHLAKVLVIDNAVLPPSEQVDDDIIKAPAVPTHIFRRVVFVRVSLQLREAGGTVEILAAGDEILHVLLVHDGGLFRVGKIR